MTQQKSKKRMAERRTQRRRQSQIRLIAGISIAAVVLVSIIAILTLAPGNQPIDNYEGLTQAIDRSGALGIAIGEPAAPVTLVEYSDFSCAHCETLATTTIKELITQYVSDGSLRIVFKPVSIIYPQYSEPAARAAICAAEQDKGWQMMDFVWGLSGPASYSVENFARIDANVGLDVQAFRQCFSAAETAETAQSVNDEAYEMGITSTPTVFVNNVQVQATAGALTQAVEAALDN